MTDGAPPEHPTSNTTTVGLHLICVGEETNFPWCSFSSLPTAELTLLLSSNMCMEQLTCASHVFTHILELLMVSLHHDGSDGSSSRCPRGQQVPLPGRDKEPLWNLQEAYHETCLPRQEIPILGHYISLENYNYYN